MRESYTPFLRVCAWVALGSGLLLFVLIIMSTVSRGGSVTGSPVPSLPDPRFLAWTFGLIIVFQAVLFFALLMVIASMADDVSDIRSHTESLAEPDEAVALDES